MDPRSVEGLDLRPSDPGQCVVLIADDEVVVRNIARSVLESDGFYTLTADHGQEALDISERFPGPIHVLLSDVEMPIINGLELRSRIVIHRPDIKVVLMSGKKLSLVDVPFLKKPFGPSALRETIAAVLKSAVPDAPCKPL